MELEKLTVEENKFLGKLRKWTFDTVYVDYMIALVAVLLGWVLVMGLLEGQSLTKVFSSLAFKAFCLNCFIWFEFFTSRRERKQVLAIIDKLAK